jgi:hypothetical protein
MLDDYPRLTRRSNDIVEDFEWLAETMGRRELGATFGVARTSRVLIAERLGITIGALDKALNRETARRNSVSVECDPERSDERNTAA